MQCFVFYFGQKGVNILHLCNCFIAHAIRHCLHMVMPSCVCMHLCIHLRQRFAIELVVDPLDHSLAFFAVTMSDYMVIKDVAKLVRKHMADAQATGANITGWEMIQELLVSKSLAYKTKQPAQFVGDSPGNRTCMINHESYICHDMHHTSTRAFMYCMHIYIEERPWCGWAGCT